MLHTSKKIIKHRVGLLDKIRRKLNLKNRVGEKTEAAVVDDALAFPAHDQVHTNHRQLVAVFGDVGRVVFC